MSNVSFIDQKGDTEKDFDKLRKEAIKTIGYAQDYLVAIQAMWGYVKEDSYFSENPTNFRLGYTNSHTLDVQVVCLYDKKYVTRNLVRFQFEPFLQLPSLPNLPYPETEIVAKFGDELAALFNVSFYFPSPDFMEYDCPEWWEQDEAITCEGCRRPLSPKVKETICSKCKLKKKKS